MVIIVLVVVFFFSSRRRHTSCALVTGVQTCALPISLDRGALWDYLRAHYGPQQMVVAAAGKIEHQDFVARVAEAFTHDGFACNGATDPATYRGGERREERDHEQDHLQLGFDGVGHLDDDYYRLSALSTTVGGGTTSGRKGTRRN